MDNLSPQRLPNETQEQYKARRIYNKKRIKQHLKGTIAWNSAQDGTFRRPRKEGLADV